jgi:hypothetical protein
MPNNTYTLEVGGERPYFWATARDAAGEQYEALSRLSGWDAACEALACLMPLAEIPSLPPIRSITPSQGSASRSTASDASAEPLVTSPLAVRVDHWASPYDHAAYAAPRGRPVLRSESARHRG